MLTLTALAELAGQYPSDLDRPIEPLVVGGRTFEVDVRPTVMGTINLSRDSTYRESIATSAESAIRKGRVMAALRAAHGAVLDMGKVGPLVKAKLGG